MLGRRQLLAAGMAAGVTAAAAPGRSAVKMQFLDPKNGRFGGELAGRDFQGLQEALDPAVLKGTVLEVLNAAPNSATRVVLDNLPTIATQGTPTSIGDPGSCEAESFGYCIGAYTAGRKPNGDQKWSAGDASNQPSCAWLYHWQHVDRSSKDCPSGSMCVPYAQQLVAYGAPSTAKYPYNPHDDTTVATVCGEIDSIPINGAGPDAARLIVGSYKGYGGIQNQEGQYREAFKSLIRAGHAIAFSGLVPYQYCVESPPLTNDAFTAPQGFIAGSGHGQVIVGFDDGKGPRGAFLVQNSFGPDWNPGAINDSGRNGRIWQSYEAFFAGQQYALIMYSNSTDPVTGQPLLPSLPTAPMLTITEGKRYQQGGQSYLALILHAKEAVNLTSMTLIGPHGDTLTTALSETLRYGYVYAQRHAAFEKGPYIAQINATTMGGQGVLYNGPFIVT